MPISLSLKNPVSSDKTLYSFSTTPAFHLSKSRPLSTQNALLLPSPRMIRSGSKENAPTTTTASLQRKKKPLPSSTSLSKQQRPSLGRRVVFSPTPLPSLQASPKHKRNFSEQLEGSSSGGTDRPAKRIRRLGIYSNHPFLGELSVDRDGSSSPEEEGEEYKSSPPTTPEEDGQDGTRQPPVKSMKEGGGGPSYFKFPFTLPGLTPPKVTRTTEIKRINVDQPRQTEEEDGDGDETDTATDSESESNFVSSLLLHRLPPSSSSISSSSPIRSPCTTLQNFPRKSSSSSSWLKGILKPVAGGIQVPKAVNEKEGTRKNGRGRKHIIGWDDMRIAEPEDATSAEGKGKKVQDDSTEAGTIDRSRGARVTRATGSKQVIKSSQDGDGEDDEEERKKRKAASSAGGGGGGAEASATSNTTRPVPRDDPWLLRTPLLVLKASLRPISAGHVRPPTSSTSTTDFAPPLEPRSSPLATEDAAMLIDEGDEGDEFTNLFETPTFLTDVESAYVDLTRAIFQLPQNLDHPSATLEPLKSFRKTFVKCVARDVENIISFPTWAKQSDTSSSSPLSSPTSSIPSSPIRTTGTSAVNGQGKKSLTEEQMRRLRDEIGVAQATLRCVAAVMRDERVFSIFTDEELTSLLRLVSTLPVSANLNNLVQRELFPFVPFILHDQTLPANVLAPLITSHLLPAFDALLSLPHRADRHRISFGETLSAISLLLSTHSKEMIREGNWRVWFRGSMVGLWDGPKKGISVKGKSLKVAGRLVRCLTSPIEWTERGMAWVRERELISRQVGETMLALLHEVPEDQLQAKKVETTRLRIFSQQWSQMTKTKPGGNTNIDEANLLFHVSLLSILPALLGAAFRKLEEKGIGAWIKPYNQLYQTQTSVHILAALALSWSNLSYGFLRATSVADEVEVPWILRRKGNENKALSVLSSIFKTRQEVWTRDATLTPTKKERQRSHAKAVSGAYAASLYGLTVSIHHGVSSVRKLDANLELSPLTMDQLQHLDEVFDRLIVPILPNLTRSPFVETSRIGWTLLTSLFRPRSPVDRFATLEAIVNPSLLEVQFASAKTSEFLDFALATIFAKAFDSSKMIGWGVEWVRNRIDRILVLLSNCATSSSILLGENFAAATWTSILDSVEADEAALSKSLDWLVQLEATTMSLPPGFTRDLWMATISRGEGPVETAVTARLERLVDGFETSQLIFSVWERTSAKPGSIAGALARGWTRLLLDTTIDVSTVVVDSVMDLLRHYTTAESLSSQSESFRKLATSLNSRIWNGDYPEIEDNIRSMLKLPSAAEVILQLCTLFLSTSHELLESYRIAIAKVGASSVESVLRSDTVRHEIIPLIANMLAAAPDDTYPIIYEAVLDSVALNRPSSDSLFKFTPLLTPSLDRAIDLHAEAVVDDGSQFETFAARPHLQASLHPLLAFTKFWRNTYAQSSLDIVYPPELDSRLSLIKKLAQDVKETQPQDSQLYSQLEESVRTFSFADERAREQLAKYVDPTTNVSTRDYEADVDQSRFHQPTGDGVTEDEEATTVVMSGPGQPSVSLHGSVDPPIGSVIQETPKEVLLLNSKASYASLASSEGNRTGEIANVEQPLLFEETLGDVKKRMRKRKRSPDVQRAVVATPGSSEDDDVIIVRSSQSSSSSVDPPKKKIKNAAKRRTTKPSVEEQNSSPVHSVDIEEKRTSSTRARRVKGKGRATVDPSVTPSASSASESASEQVGGSTNVSSRKAHRRVQDEEAIRRVLSLPLETVAHVGKLIGGTASLHRLMAIGEAAKDYFEKLKRSPSH